MAYISVKEERELTYANGRGKKLTPKMLSFINAYFGPAQFVVNKAVELSEYKCSTPGSIHQVGAELMTHPLVIKEIKRRMDIREQKSEVKAEYLINKLMQIVEATQEDNPNSALRAIELLGKSIAMWRERQEVSGPDGAAIQHEQHVKESVADFTSRIASLAKRNESNVVQFK